MKQTGRKMLAASGAAMLLATAALAGAGGAVVAQDDKVTVDWWHIQHTEPLLSIWQEVADEYMAENPNVEIVITPNQ